MEYIYIVLERSHTLLGRLARLIDPYEYTHITVNLDGKMKRFYSFSRFLHYAPFCSGFMKETLDCYAYGKNKKVKLKVFKVPVTHEEKKRIKAFIRGIYEDRKNYVFNLYSALTMSMIGGFEIYKTYNCMSFTGKVLSMTDAVKMDRPYYRYTIEELDILLTDYFYEEKEFERKSVDTPGYMRPVDPLFNAGAFIRLNAVLLYRMMIRKK